MGRSDAFHPGNITDGRLQQGAFDSFTHENLPRTKYDQIVDETSNKPQEQAFEVRHKRIVECST